MYVGIPNTFNVTAPSSLTAGSQNVGITVRNSTNQLVEGASVVLTDSNGLQILGFTDASGFVLLNVPASQSLALTLTVSKHDFKPAISIINIVTAGGIVYDSAIIDDNVTGNGDGILNSGEEVNLILNLKNTTSSTILLSADVSCTDPYITLIAYDRIEYNSIAPNAYGENESPIAFSVAANCPDNHQVVLSVFIEGSSQNWTISVPITVRNGKLTMQSYSFVGSTGNIIYPGNSFPMSFSLTNAGLANLSGINGILRSYDRYFSITDSLGYFGSISSGSTISNTANRYEVYARGTCVNGMTIPLELYLYNATGFSQTISLTLTIGQTTVTDPLGQDAYGYFIFDQGDTGYAQHPTYQWVPIAPAESGSGTLLTLTDPGVAGDEGDQVGAVSIQTVTLPFTFSFYGVNYNQASISSNGFIAFGATQNSDWRNWRLPGAGGPNPMIAVFWDDLEIGTGSGVYTYYNAAMHYYVVEWYEMVSGYDQTSRQTFQAILYDPVYYPTYTNDGQVKLQYKQFNNIDLGSGGGTEIPHGNYSTIGIKDHEGLVGLEYTFNNSYPTAAATLTNQSALFITPRAIPPVNPHIIIQQVNVLGGNGNGYLEPGESSNLSIQLVNSASTIAPSVSTMLSSTDPYVTINSTNAFYGNIPAESSANPISGNTITVAANCPAEHSIMFTLTITSNEDSWIYNFTQTVHTPILGFGSHTILDPTGNNNGILDPGETVSIVIPLYNTGIVASPSGIVSLSCSTNGISVVNGSVAFAAVTAGGVQSITSTISASSSMSIGTLAEIIFSANAGSYSANLSEQIEIGAPQIVDIGVGTATQTYPIDRFYNYSAHEAIYLASEIGMSGAIKAIAFNKASGADVSEIESVSIYMKHTSSSTLNTGDYSLDGYTLVYSGSFTNNATSGWMEVNLNNMFSYNNSFNLSVLVVKDFQQYLNSEYPLWTYSTAAQSRARQDRDDNNAPTSLTASSNLPNVRFKMFPINDPILMPPTNLVALAGNAFVNLSWTAALGRYSYPVPTELGYKQEGSKLSFDLAGSVSDDRSISGYKIYRNNTVIFTTTGTSFRDNNVVNSVTYSYYVKTQYTNPVGESAASNTVTATPTDVIPQEVVVGTGVATTDTQSPSPINIYYKSLHGQSVYTAAELHSLGVFGPIQITQLGFNIVGAPTLALPSFLVRMKHTTATNVASWQDATDMITVYTNASYMPVAGGFDMLTLSNPFTWNGIDNLVVDTAFGLLPQYTATGTLQYTTLTNGYRYNRNDDVDQTNNWTEGSASNIRPNIKFVLAVQPNLGAPGVSISQEGTSVNLQWEQVPNATQYNVYRSLSPEGPFSLIGSTALLQYTDNPLDKAFYQVKASQGATSRATR
ncbi:MAG: carboxypeptidase-like regulatory domain-containing protein [Candidatus Cloacimonetes bacterium]|nr:carboxypeptidase-like regulatory domain-containing protein [Candidatus Cloacimonadota bacterium]